MIDDTRQRQHTNGRVRVENAIADARQTLQSSKRGGVRGRKLIVPVLLGAAILLLLRRFEDDSSPPR